MSGAVVDASSRRDLEPIAKAEVDAPSPDARSEVPSELLPWERVLKPPSQPSGRDDKPESSQVSIDMEHSSASPQRIASLADFVSRLNISLVRIWYSQPPDVCYHQLRR